MSRNAGVWTKSFTQTGALRLRNWPRSSIWSNWSLTTYQSWIWLSCELSTSHYITTGLINKYIHSTTLLFMIGKGEIWWIIKLKNSCIKADMTHSRFQCYFPTPPGIPRVHLYISNGHLSLEVHINDNCHNFIIIDSYLPKASVYRSISINKQTQLWTAIGSFHWKQWKVMVMELGTLKTKRDLYRILAKFMLLWN